MINYMIHLVFFEGDIFYGDLVGGQGPRGLMESCFPFQQPECRKLYTGYTSQHQSRMNKDAE